MIVADRLFAWVWLDVFQHEDAPVRRDVILRGYSEPHVAIPKELARCRDLQDRLSVDIHDHHGGRRSVVQLRPVG